MKNSASKPVEAGHLIRHRRSKLGRRKVFGDTKSKSKLIRHKDVGTRSYQEPDSRSERVKRAATARPEEDLVLEKLNRKLHVRSSWKLKHYERNKPTLTHRAQHIGNDR